MDIPQDFLEDMQALLGGAYGDFARALREQPPARGLRVNTLKLSLMNSRPSPPTRSRPRRSAAKRSSWKRTRASASTLTTTRDFSICRSPPPPPSSRRSTPPRHDGARPLRRARRQEHASRRASGGRRRARLKRMRRRACASAFIKSGTHRRAQRRRHLRDAGRARGRPRSVLRRGRRGRAVLRRGMFRRDEEAVRQWSREHVAGCAARQALILADAARLVRGGGVLVYSTCTLNIHENEDTIDRFHGTSRILAGADQRGFAASRLRRGARRPRRALPGRAAHAAYRARRRALHRAPATPGRRR